MMLKFGLVWMGEPVRMPVVLISLLYYVQSPHATTPMSRLEAGRWRDNQGHTILDQLSNEDSYLHRCQDIHNPRYPPTEPALFFLLPLLHPRSKPLRISVVPCRTTIIHLRLVLQRDCVLVCKRVRVLARRRVVPSLVVVEM